MSHSDDDIHTVEVAFLQRFGDRLANGRATGFAGLNMMTPDLLGFVHDHNGTPVEISTGAGFSGSDRLFGVTWPRTAAPADDRSGCVFSLDEVADALAAGKVE